MNEYMFIVYVCIVYYVVLLTMLMAVHRVLVLFSAFDDIGGEAVQCSACDDIEAVHVVLVFYSALALAMILVVKQCFVAVHCSVAVLVMILKHCMVFYSALVHQCL